MRVFPPLWTPPYATIKRAAISLKKKWLKANRTGRKDQDRPGRDDSFPGTFISSAGPIEKPFIV